MSHNRNVNSKTILFLGHDAKRTGAPMVLLALLRWIRENTKWNIHLLLGYGGSLLPEYEKLADVHVLSPSQAASDPTLISRIMRKLSSKSMNSRIADKIKRIYPAGSVDFVYCNTAASASMLANVDHLHVPVIAHIHEMAYSIEQYGGDYWGLLSNSATHYIAVSKAVHDDLVKCFSVAPEKITIIYASMANQSISKNGQTMPEFTRSALKIPPDYSIVLGCGADRWRKGMDVFLQVLSYLKTDGLAKPVVGVWVGDTPGGREQKKLMYDVKKMGLEKDFIHVPHVNSVKPYYEACDVFCMTSREDPFPTVNLEAAWCNKPVVCFAGSGGSAEFVRDDAGFCVPYMDIKGMAVKIRELIENPTLRASMGRVGHDRVRDFHSPELMASRIMEIISGESVKC